MGGDGRVRDDAWHFPLSSFGVALLALVAEQRPCELLVNSERKIDMAIGRRVPRCTIEFSCLFLQYLVICVYAHMIACYLDER